jgi:hypothetical protein
MSLKQGFVLGMGALAGGSLGFYIQGVMMEKYRVKTEKFIGREVERRACEEKSPPPTTTTKSTTSAQYPPQ